jgi:arginine decarboxylase
MKSGCKLDQSETPLFDCFNTYANSDIIPFHVPGHKKGQGADRAMRELLGERALRFDNTSLPQTGNLQRAQGPILAAQELAADLYGAKASFFSVNGTSGAIMSMVLSVLKSGDKIIVQRNVHKSVTAGIILSGAVPVYVQPIIDDELGIAHGVTPQAVEAALIQNPDAKAVLVVSPTYYGVVSDIRGIASVAHARGIPLLVDEAHGAHLRFSSNLPEDALAQGADLVAQSTHKTMGSLTQSSMLHVNGDLVSPDRVGAVLSMMQTTSPSFFLLASLDCARRDMALYGRERWDHTVSIYQDARARINRIEGCFAFGREHLKHLGVNGFDPTRLTVCCWDLQISGRAMEKLLCERYHIQMELSDFYNVLAIGSHGDTKENLDCLVAALEDISQNHKYQKMKLKNVPVPDIPDMVQTPREAFFGPTSKVRFDESEGLVSSEFIMSYPPGIPILCPGEIITRDIIDYAHAMKEAGLLLTGMEDSDLNTLRISEGSRFVGENLK